MKTTSTIRSLLAFGALLASSAPLHAADIAWESEYQSQMYDSAGNTLGSTIYFEIGTFQTGFTPTVSNMDLWATNWKTFDAAYDGDTNGIWDAPNGQFGGGSALDASGHSLSPDANPSTVFTEGEQLYMWAYNSKTYQAGSEWALITKTQPTGTPAFNDWVVPDPTIQNITTQATLQQADIVVFGGLNDIQGPGSYDTGAAPVTFDLQLHAVPEPGSLMLIALGMLGFVRRRR